MTQIEELLNQAKELYSRFGVHDLAPILVLITGDCREQSIPGYQDLANHYGINLGDFHYPDILRMNRGEPDDTERMHDAVCVHPDEYDETAEFDIALPLILADTGDFIWGIESFWGPIDDLDSIAEQVLDIKSAFDDNDAFGKLEQAIQLQKSYGPLDGSDYEGLTFNPVNTDDAILELAELKYLHDNEALARTDKRISQAKAIEKAEYLAEHPYMVLRIAHLDGEAIGYWAATNRGNEFFSQGIYVTPEHRGRGFGTQIKQHQVDFARMTGFDAIISNMDQDNQASIRIHEKLGFSLKPTGKNYQAELVFQ